MPFSGPTVDAKRGLPDMSLYPLSQIASKRKYRDILTAYDNSRQPLRMKIKKQNTKDIPDALK